MAEIFVIIKTTSLSLHGLSQRVNFPAIPSRYNGSRECNDVTCHAHVEDMERNRRERWRTPCVALNRHLAGSLPIVLPSTTMDAARGTWYLHDGERNLIGVRYTNHKTYRYDFYSHTVRKRNIRMIKCDAAIFFNNRIRASSFFIYL